MYPSWEMTLWLHRGAWSVSRPQDASIHCAFGMFWRGTPADRSGSRTHVAHVSLPCSYDSHVLFNIAHVFFVKCCRIVAHSRMALKAVTYISPLPQVPKEDNVQHGIFASSRYQACGALLAKYRKRVGWVRCSPPSFSTLATVILCRQRNR